MSTAAQNSDNFWNLVILILAAWWWVILPALGGVAAAIYEGVQIALRTHHKRKLALLRERARIAAATARVDERRAELTLPYVPPAAIEKPGVRPCLHNRVVTPVISNGKRVAWYCPSCDQQLPADWALEPEDL